MTRILAIDLGKFKSVTCLLKRPERDGVLDDDDRPAVPAHGSEERYTPDLVVIESCGLAGWVHDVCTAEAIRCWSAIRIRKPGGGGSSNERPTVTMR